jgi:hypothetical protein
MTNASPGGEDKEEKRMMASSASKSCVVDIGRQRTAEVGVGTRDVARALLARVNVSRAVHRYNIEVACSSHAITIDSLRILSSKCRCPHPILDLYSSFLKWTHTWPRKLSIAAPP